MIRFLIILSVFLINSEAKNFIPIQTPQSKVKYGELDRGMKSAASGMKLNKQILRIIAENISHMDTYAHEPGGEAYREKIPIVKTEIDPLTGVVRAVLSKIKDDQRDLHKVYMPHHPGADETGFVQKSNVEFVPQKVLRSATMAALNANMSSFQNMHLMRKREIELINGK